MPKSKIDTNPEKIERLLTRGVAEVIDREHLRKQLLSGKQLRVKLGFDPTGGNIHIGRAIALRKLREFQNLGHHAMFLVGDFTAKIGDPSDKLDKRPTLSDSQIKENLKTYKEQVGKIVDLKKADFLFNSKWLSKLTFADILDLQSLFTVDQMLSRRNFADRTKEKKVIGLHELSYPLMQGYDSVPMKADVEIGGSDQLFNLQAGRTIQPHFGLSSQDILTTEMLEGTDGRKMSTSWGNVINIMDEPNDMFGKVMSVKDELVDKYIKLCTDFPESTEALVLATKNPMDKKASLALEIVRMYHGGHLAAKAQEEWVNVFIKGNAPTDIPEVKIDAHAMNLAELLVVTQLAESKTAARRLIEQGGVQINDVKKTDPAETIAIDTGMVVQVGPRRFVKIRRK